MTNPPDDGLGAARGCLNAIPPALALWTLIWLAWRHLT